MIWMPRSTRLKAAVECGNENSCVPDLTWHQLLRVWSCCRLSRFSRNLQFGQLGERVAVAFLRASGYRIVSRQYRDATGELDIIALDCKTIVFIEVKSRRGSQWMDAWESIDHDKQQRISRAAARFLKRHALNDRQVRFDAIGILWPDPARLPLIKHLKHAFESSI